MEIGGSVEVTLFPATTKHAASLVNGTETDVSSVYFADKILVTISQGGRLSQWVRSSIPSNCTYTDQNTDPSPSLVSLSNLV
jgi:proteasome assembly chaperone 3